MSVIFSIVNPEQPLYVTPVENKNLVQASSPTPPKPPQSAPTDLSQQEWFEHEIAQSQELSEKWANGTAFDTPEHAQSWVTELYNLQVESRNSPYLSASDKWTLDNDCARILNSQAVDAQGNLLYYDNTNGDWNAPIYRVNPTGTLPNGPDGKPVPVIDNSYYFDPVSGEKVYLSKEKVPVSSYHLRTITIGNQGVNPGRFHDSTGRTNDATDTQISLQYYHDTENQYFVDGLQKITTDLTAASTFHTDAENATSMPYDTSAPAKMLAPFCLRGSGNDVQSKTYLMLECMKDNDSNSNDAEVFLLYLSNICNAANNEAYDPVEFQNLETQILSINDSHGQSLVDECVDIMMMQMCVTGGYTPEEAEQQMKLLFPGDDDISKAVRKEAGFEGDELEKKIDPTTGKITITEDDIDTEWKAFITNTTTTTTISQAQSGIMGNMIREAAYNVYAAIIVVLLLLESKGIISLDAYTALTAQLQEESNELTVIMTKWNDPTTFDTAAGAQAWMDEVKDLQEEMNETPFSAETMIQIDANFNAIYNQPAVGNDVPYERYPNGEIQYKDSAGNSVNKDGVMVNPQGYILATDVISEDDLGATVYFFPGGTNPNGNEQDIGWYREGSNPPDRVPNNDTFSQHMGKVDVTPVYLSTGAQKNYLNGQPQYKDSAGNSVDANGQLVGDINGYPFYTARGADDGGDGSTVYYKKDGYYYTQGGSALGSTSNVYIPMMGQVNVTPVYQEDAKNYQPIYVDNTTGKTYYQTGNGDYEACDRKSTMHLTPAEEKARMEPVTIGELAWGPNADPLALQDSLQYIQTPTLLDVETGKGGVSPQKQAIDASLEALTNPLSQQTAAVGAIVQQKMTLIQQYDTSFDSILIDGQLESEKRILNNIA